MEGMLTEQIELNNPLLSNQMNDSPQSSSSISIVEQSNNDLNAQKQKEAQEENERFTKHSPLVSLLIFSIGPLANVASLLFETISMYFITKRFGNIKDSYAIEILGFSGQYQNFLTVTGMFFGQCFITRMGSLIGSGKRDDAVHFTSDIFKLTIISTIIYIIPMAFVIKPMLTFVGTPDYMVEPAWKYNLFLLFFALFSNIFSAEQSFILSIGRPILAAIICTASKTFQTLALDPFFLFACKVPTKLMKLSKVTVDVTFSIVLFIVIFLGKFSMKPTLKMFFGCTFSKETFRSLLFPIPFTFAFVTSLFPPMIILKALTDGAKESGASQAIGAVFAVFTQISALNAGLPSMLTTSFMTTGTHAYSSGNVTRLKSLLYWSLGIALTISVCFSFALIVFKRQVASWFIHDEGQLEIASKMLPIPFYTSFVQGFVTIAMALLMIVGKPLLVLVPTVLGPVILIVTCIVLKKVFKDDFIKLMHCYNVSDVAGLLIYCGMFVYALVLVRRKEREQNGKGSGNGKVTWRLLKAYYR